MKETAEYVNEDIFRDFSNILIIGIFTFIALSIILGLKEFGQKKLIANVLIVAVLINFSLLFTELIIDASNFTASVIYEQMAGTSSGPNPAFDISQAFLTPMHITSVWDTYDVVHNVATSPGGTGVQAFAFGLVGGVLLFAAAVILFYGCFLIAARALLFIFLMLTSSLAFATYLVPNLQKSSFGWDNWWKSLVNAAMFAPLLMIFLAISLSILNAAGQHATTPIGNIIGDPQAALTTGGAWQTIFVYMIGIGMLFLSFKMASSFASKISGLNISGGLLAAPFTLGSSYIAAPLLRQTVGRVAQLRKGQFEKQVKGANEKAGTARAQTQSLTSDSTTQFRLRDRKLQEANKARENYDFVKATKLEEEAKAHREEGE